jgi:hypothetical protein
MIYAIEITSGGMIRIYIPNFIMIITGVQIILIYYPQKFERA